MRSIERRLLTWLCGTLLLGAVLLVATVYVVTLDEINEAFDTDLRNVATGLAAYRQRLTPGEPAASAASVISGRRVGVDGIDTVDAGSIVRSAGSASAADGSGNAGGVGVAFGAGVGDESPDAAIVSIVRTRDGRLLYASDPRVPLGADTTPGLSRLRLGGEDWVVYTVAQDDAIVQAAQRRRARSDTASESAAKLLPALFALAAALAGLLVFGLRRGLRPLDAAARDVARRSARSLDPIAVEAVPAELAPLVRAINGLMAQLAHSLATQRRFVADAAHELRTPIAALRLQLHLLEKSAGEPERGQATAALKQGVARAQRLIEQLLAIARADPAGSQEPLQPVMLDELVRDIVEPHAARAEDRGIDLGADLRPAEVLGDREQLAVLLDNLIDNALRYTPRGGVVDIVVEPGAPGGPCLRVRDTGPGIPIEDRPRVFARFFRGVPAAGRADHAGSGLGLAIVKAIAERHGATVELSDGPDGRGLDVRVGFPSRRP